MGNILQIISSGIKVAMTGTIWNLGGHQRRIGEKHWYKPAFRKSPYFYEFSM